MLIVRLCLLSWLSFGDAVEALTQTYSSTVCTLMEIASMVNSDKNAQALAEAISNKQFVHTLALMADTLPQLNKLSIALQAEVCCLFLPAI